MRQQRPMRRLCEAPACGAYLGDSDASHDVRLCTACTDRVASQLSGLPALYLACERALEVRRDRGIDRISGWRPDGIRLNERAMDSRAAMIRVLSSWCALIVDERTVDEHAVDEQTVGAPPGREVSALTGFLCEHLGWLRAHPAAADFAREISELVAGAKTAVQPPSRQDRMLGWQAGQAAGLAKTLHDHGPFAGIIGSNGP